MTKTSILFIDTPIELIPKEIQHDYLIKKNAKKRNKLSSEIILDSSYHYKSMQKLSNSNRRGRPDIIHFCLLNALGSLLNKDKKMDIYIHTINNQIIRVNQIVRLPRNYNRFIGLMEQLLKEKVVKSNKEILLEILENKKIADLVKKYSFNDRILLSRKGKLVNIFEFLKERNDRKLLFGIGAFPFGEIDENISILFEKKIAISKYSLEAWIVVNEVISSRYQTTLMSQM